MALGPDGALYVADDVSGRIWRITFQGDVAKTGVVAARPLPSTALRAGEAGPPEGVDPNAGASNGRALPTPPESTEAEVALGARIFNGQAGNGTCAGCHGADGAGSPLGPRLTGGKWLWGDGSLAAIRRIVVQGVPEPKQYRSPMPPKGGAPLADSDVAAVAAYVWALGQSGQGGMGQEGMS